MQDRSTLQYIAIDQIHESATNPRQTFEPSKLEELAESIRQHGLIQPITIRPNASGFAIVAGARRFRAALLAELFSLPARIVDLDDAAAMEWQLVENSQRALHRAFLETSGKGMQARSELVRAQGMSAVVESSLQRWFTQKTRERRPDITDRLTKTLLSDDADTHAAIWDIISALDVEDRLSEISCPTLVIVGEADPSTPPAVAHRLADAIKGASLILIPEASHIVTVEAPSAVNTAVLRFLATTAGRSS